MIQKEYKKPEIKVTAIRHELNILTVSLGDTPAEGNYYDEETDVLV